MKERTVIHLRKPNEGEYRLELDGFVHFDVGQKILYGKDNKRYVISEKESNISREGANIIHIYHAVFDASLIQ